MTGKRRRSGGETGKFVLGLLLGPLVLAAAGMTYVNFGRLPAAVADKPFPLEKFLIRRPVNKRIDRELTGPPLGSGPEVFEAGAQIYKSECASCHGLPGHDAVFAKYMYPKAPQLWKRGGIDNVVGVSEVETGRTYWKIAHGVRLSGMPAYSKILSETEMWQVTLLLKHSGDKLPDSVTAMLKP